MEEKNINHELACMYFRLREILSTEKPLNFGVLEAIEHNWVFFREGYFKTPKHAQEDLIKVQNRYPTLNLLESDIYRGAFDINSIMEHVFNYKLRSKWSNITEVHLLLAISISNHLNKPNELEITELVNKHKALVKELTETNIKLNNYFSNNIKL